MHYRKLLLSVAVSAAIVGCSTDDGDDGSNGADGISSLINQVSLEQGNEQCFNGGVQVNSGSDNNANGVLDTDEVEQSSTICQAGTVNSDMNFNRVASFPVCSQLESNCDIDTETAAEIVAVSGDKNTLIYTDSPAETVGFIDITNSQSPVADGTLDLSGEPTSVAVKGNLALVGVNTTPSGDFVNVAGQLDVVDITTRQFVASIDLGGQPDSVAISPDGNYAAVVLENERDEDLGDGAPPQLPAGEFVIVDTSSADPSTWTISKVDITGIADLYAGDPEPEFVDINTNNIAVVTMQENNHIVLIDLTDGSIVNDFSAGSVDLDNIDLTEEDPALISQTESEDAVLREPDGVSWINTEYFATANEGDLDGGSRGFTVFNTAGDVIWDAGNTLDHLTARLGHYPDGRSGNKGNEPENIELGIYGDNRYLFVNSERSSLVFVYDMADPTKPVYKQTLPAGVGPEGGLAIPERNLLVVASEEDNRDDKIRSAVNIYRYEDRAPIYPTIKSVDRDNGTPIPWSALSGLSSDPMDDSLIYSVEDSFYQSNRIFTIDVDETPARLVAELTIKDSNDVLAAVTTSGATEDPDSFDDVDLAAMINTDKTVNLDPEGVSKASDGGYWVASEGAGTLTDTVKRPIEKLNFLIKTDSNGVIEKAITLPQPVNDLQIRFGFEGVAEYNGNVYVAFQRAWEGESNPRIGIYDITNDTWSFVFYPLDAAISQNGGWVGLSDISSLGNGEFLIVERDNQGGVDAAIKRLYKVDLSSAVANSVISKTLVRDLMNDLKKPGGLVAEKVEGSAVMSNGDVYIINDNDGVDDNSGETQLINLGNIL
jgi:hypothetical protein